MTSPNGHVPHNGGRERLPFGGMESAATGEYASLDRVLLLPRAATVAAVICLSALCLAFGAIALAMAGPIVAVLFAVGCVVGVITSFRT